MDGTFQRIFIVDQTLTAFETVLQDKKNSNLHLGAYGQNLIFNTRF